MMSEIKLTPIERETLDNELIIYLSDLGYTLDDIKSGTRIFRSLDGMQKWTDERISEKININDIISNFRSIVDRESKMTHRATLASDFGEDDTRWAWYPYIPIGDYTVMMASGGSGKTILCCLIASYISRGENFPEDTEKRKPKRVLFISAEDRGELLKKRLEACGANLDNIYILDCESSYGMNFGEKYGEFLDTVSFYKPEIVFIDPWHAFLGAETDINRINAIRPVFQSLSNMAKKIGCALVLISHENKRSQGENINYSATGSTDFINAARSAVKVIMTDDETEKNVRIMVHTKSNYAESGQSIRYKINASGGADFDGFSNITRSTLEEAARDHKTPSQVIKNKAEREYVNHALIKAVKDKAELGKTVNISYLEFKEIFGANIFGEYQPKRALDGIKSELEDSGITLLLGKSVKYNGKSENGFGIYFPQPLMEENDSDEDDNPFLG